jgi:putative ABC transport system ATP-binding protein
MAAATMATTTARAALASVASGQRGNSMVRALDTRPEPGSSARATIWTRAAKAPYERGDADPAAPNPGRNDRRNDCMHDTSGSRLVPAIALTGVNLSLGRGAARVHILKDIHLHIGRGEAIGLIGPSGSGKSTLLMVMAGLERADTGSVTAAGEPLGALSEDALARFRGRNIGIVFQSFHLIPTMTALENVAVPLELAGVADAQERATRELAAVGLSERCHHYPAELSGGEQQRVALARALAPNPAILIADEPTGNLDETTGSEIIDLLFAGHEQRGTTLVLVTHDPALARRCDRVVRLRSGRIDGAGS